MNREHNLDGFARFVLAPIMIILFFLMSVRVFTRYVLNDHQDGLVRHLQSFCVVDWSQSGVKLFVLIQ